MPKQLAAGVTKIGKRVIDAAALGSRPYVIWDAELKGFGIVVRPSGVKTYVYRYRTVRSRKGRQRTITIGKNDDLTALKARAEAETLRDTVRAGRDPLRERKGVGTVAELLDAYIGSPRFTAKAPSTQSIDRGRIERHLKPTLGRDLVDKLTRDDIERALVKIRDGKTATNVKTKPRGRALVKGGPGAARMAIELLRTAFNWAIVERRAQSNPCAHLDTGPSGQRETILEDATAYARLFSTLDRMQREKRIPDPVADAIRVIALTGARRGEIADLRWEYVDLKEGKLKLPPSAHKTGRKTGKPRVIALPTVAQAIIARQPRTADKAIDYVFARRRGSLASSLTHAWRRRRRRKDGKAIEQGVAIEAKLPADIGLHGLRHSHGSHMAMDGASAAEIMTALGHTQLSTATRYIHWADERRKSLAERAAGVALAGLAESSGSPAGGDVVALKP